MCHGSGNNRMAMSFNFLKPGGSAICNKEIFLSNSEFILSHNHIFGAAKVTILFRFGIKFYKKFHILGILPIFAVACNKYITMLYES